VDGGKAAVEREGDKKSHSEGKFAKRIF